MTTTALVLGLIALAVSAVACGAAVVSAKSARNSERHAAASLAVAKAVQAIEGRRDYEERTPAFRTRIEAVNPQTETPWHRLWLHLDSPGRLDSVRVEVVNSKGNVWFDSNDGNVSVDGTFGTYSPVSVDSTAPAWRVHCNGHIPEETRVKVTSVLDEDQWTQYLRVDWPRDVTQAIW